MPCMLGESWTGLPGSHGDFVPMQVPRALASCAPCAPNQVLAYVGLLLRTESTAENALAVSRTHASRGALFQLRALAAQVECPSVTPEVVLKASGHVDRFTDFMVTDAVTHDCHRADHLLEAALEARLGDAKAPPSAEEREVRACCA